MPLNDIKLSDFIISEWFGDTLVTSPDSNGGEFAPIKPSSPNSIPPASAAPSPKPSKPTSPAAPHTSESAPAPHTPETTPAPHTPVSPAPPSSTAPIKYLGNNRRNITLLVQTPGSPFLPDNQLAFLTRILEACRMTLADVAIVNNAATPVTIAGIKQQLHPTTIFLFGLEPTAIRLPINFPAFRPQDYDGCTYLSAPSLDQLVPNSEESKLLKSKLWVCLKTIFDV
jgi:hypothetical protein